ncbi:hypothetical protein ABZ318_13475 [Streptomyces sp. NPDC006197]|uniref:hypothetical protein n=1 Tax=Streptomyces sp. NPDC006197 TaxID=3156685 RepID=UPI0033A0ED81
MLTFDNVYQAPLDKMKAAADDWAAMKGKLDTLARDARSTMAAKAGDDYWRGVNAEVTKPFVDKTAKEFGDAAKAADGIHKVLEDGYNAFKKAKDELKKTVETEAPAKGFRVRSDGTVEAVDSLLGTHAYHSAGTGLARTVNVLIEDQAREGRPPGHPSMCEVTTEASPRSGIDIDVWLYDRGALYDDGAAKWWTSGRYLYEMGRETSTDNKSASLFVQCTSPRLKGSDKQPAPVGASLEFDKPTKGSYPASTPATREAYLTVLHSVTLAVVKKPGCENDAGLPETPVFTGKKWRGESSDR